MQVDSMVQTVTQNLDEVNGGSHEELERIKNLMLINPSSNLIRWYDWYMDANSLDSAFETAI